MFQAVSNCNKVIKFELSCNFFCFVRGEGEPFEVRAGNGGPGRDIRGLSQYSQVIVGIELETKPRPLRSTPFSAYYSLSTYLLTL
jgi:hypothetical protein